MPARAQLILPGAMPHPPGASGRAAPPGRTAPAGPAAVAVRAPEEETIIGRPLQRNGATGIMTFEKQPDGLTISKLAMVGYKISVPTDICRVEFGEEKIISRPAPRHEGLLSYDVDLKACPFSYDVLDGAVRVRGKTCDIAAADCRLDPSGVWGPPGTSIGPEEAKTIEKLRTRAESEARSNFRALMASVGHDRIRVREIARDQAGFSSRREEICRTYAREDQHGFCNSRITMAHAIALYTELHAENPTKKPARKRPRRKPPVAAGLGAAAPEIR
jgi:hypothetical protein